MQAPDRLDGARVLWWAWSDDPPFFVMCDGAEVVAVCGLAIARYQSGAVYRFSCDREWSVVNDSPYGDEHAALASAHGQYDVSRVAWRRAGAAEPDAG